MGYFYRLSVGNRSGADYRFKLFMHEGKDYTTILPEQAPVGMPILFKPMGAPRPQSSYIASDADYVDYITELMGGFAVPSFIKQLRGDKRYLFLGMRFNRDSERIVMSDIIHGAARPAGWVFIETPTDKEQRYLKKMGIEIVNADCMEMLAAARPA